MDREKVIKGLERCLKHTCSRPNSKEYEECEYTTGLYCRQDKVMFDALELLKAQEPRVMTPEELEALPDGEEYNAPVCLEQKYPVTTWDVGTLCIWTSARLVTEYFDDNVFFNRDTYNKTWRAWTDWPSSANREAVKWDGI